VEDTGEGLKVDWRWTHVDYRWTTGGLQVDSMDYIWTGGGLHKDPWVSVRYSDKAETLVPLVP